ncbi:hypothetical protein T439DRAFT_378390 [Meredithblackwellia eburnea MCA 4105]
MLRRESLPNAARRAKIGISSLKPCLSTFQNAGDTTATEMALEKCLCLTLTGQQPTNGPQCINCVVDDTSLSQASFQAIAQYYNAAGDACEADGYIVLTGTTLRSMTTVGGVTTTPAEAGGDGGVTTTSPFLNQQPTTTSPSLAPGPQITSTPVSIPPSPSALGSGVGATAGTAENGGVTGGVTVTVTASVAATNGNVASALASAPSPSTTAKSAAAAGRCSKSFRRVLFVAAAFAKLLM